MPSGSKKPDTGRTTPTDPLERMAKHLRCYRHYSGLARQASKEALREATSRAPGWGARWCYWMDVHATSAGIARNDARRYAKIKAALENTNV